MALTAHRNTLDMCHALVASMNATRREAAIVGSHFHADVTSQTTGDPRAPAVAALTLGSANASDLPTLLTLCAELASKYAISIADTLAHKVADVTNTLANAAPTDLPTAITFLNDAKAKFNLHIASTTYHYTADSTNTVSATNASDQATADTLANALKTSFNAHIQSAPAGYSINLVD